MKPIATDTSDFPEMRRDGCIYVDKTAYLYRLITQTGSKRLFLSRPRRFGKSLMISTLKAIFQGRRDLFEGLAITKTDWAWETYPVLHFNFGTVSTHSVEAFEADFPFVVQNSLTQAGYAYDERKAPSVNFGMALQELSAKNGGKGVVVLIDEYDDPVAKSLADIPKAEAIRDRLADFYVQMKDRTGDIRFLMITGVSKFTKLSIFSTLSNLVDISFDDEVSTMLGYTEEELDIYFSEHMAAHAGKMGLSPDDYRAELKRMYNGYRFGRFNAETVYNPVSIGWTMAKREPVFNANWASTGRASALMNYLKREGMLALDYENLRGVSDAEFDVSDLAHLKPVGMLFQTGYLTIKDYNAYSHLYTLCIPDDEVRRDLSSLLAGVAADRDMGWAQALGTRLLIADFPAFFNGLRSLYAALPYGSGEGRVPEFSYQRCLCFLLAAHGIRYRAEEAQTDGRVDIVAEHPCGVYLFELKVDDTAASALDQVKSKGYDAPYRASNRPIYAIGLAFDSKTRQFVDGAAEQL